MAHGMIPGAWLWGRTPWWVSLGLGPNGGHEWWMVRAGKGGTTAPQGGWAKCQTKTNDMMLLHLRSWRQ